MNVEPRTGRDSIGKSRLARWLALVYAGVWIGTAIRPFHRQDWFLENLLVILVVPVVILIHRQGWFSRSSCLTIFAFMVLHAIGAHFTYTAMPLADWFRESFGGTRNHYDRLVHFGFGLLLANPIRETLTGLGVRKRWLASTLAVHAIMAWSGLYEVMEGMLAHFISPELGAAFNGIQGDIWDAQKDMSLALIGAIIAVVLPLLLQRRASQPAPHPAADRTVFPATSGETQSSPALPSRPTR